MIIKQILVHPEHKSQMREYLNTNQHSFNYLGSANKQAPMASYVQPMHSNVFSLLIYLKPTIQMPKRTMALIVLLFCFECRTAKDVIDGCLVTFYECIEKIFVICIFTC